jgi:hypothetical protein
MFQNLIHARRWANAPPAAEGWGAGVGPRPPPSVSLTHWLTGQCISGSCWIPTTETRQPPQQQPFSAEMRRGPGFSF